MPRGATGAYSSDLPYLDSDLYKWLEAAAWAGDARVGEVAALIAQAQDPSGYLQSYFQVVRPERRFADLERGHELYCAGHLIEAAVASGRRDLLEVATCLADHVGDTFGPGRREGVCRTARPRPGPPADPLCG